MSEAVQHIDPAERAFRLVLAGEDIAAAARWCSTTAAAIREACDAHGHDWAALGEGGVICLVCGEDQAALLAQPGDAL